MLDPDDLAKDVKSVDSKLEVLVNEFRKTNIQVLEVRKLMEMLSRDNNCMNTQWLSIIIIFNGDLRFAVRTKVRHEVPLFMADFSELHQ